jgi:hypothetical protein
MAKKDEPTPSYSYGGSSRIDPPPSPEVKEPAPEGPPIQEYPKVMYRQDSADRVTVNSEAEEDALGEGWYDSPTPAEPAPKTAR